MRFFLRVKAVRYFLMTIIFSLALLPHVASGEVVDRVVAVVNDSIITLSELNAAYTRLRERP